VSQIVIDASAVIALLRDEQGGDQVEQALAGSEHYEIAVARISAVNLTEIHQQLGPTLPALIGGAGSVIQVADFTAEQAAIAAAMQEATRPLGLSLADRACLALAKELGLSVLTADRTWADAEVGVDVTLIR